MITSAVCTNQKTSTRYLKHISYYVTLQLIEKANEPQIQWSVSLALPFGLFIIIPIEFFSSYVAIEGKINKMREKSHIHDEG